MKKGDVIRRAYRSKPIGPYMEVVNASNRCIVSAKPLGSLDSKVLSMVFKKNAIGINTLSLCLPKYGFNRINHYKLHCRNYMVEKFCITGQLTKNWKRVIVDEPELIKFYTVDKDCGHIWVKIQDVHTFRNFIKISYQFV